MPLDDLARFNQERWDDLARSGVEYARPYLDMDKDAARDLVDPDGFIGDVRGLDILCLAAGGGQQTAAFGLLGANVTCIDLSDEQLERDRIAADHYGLEIKTVQGDMRDLSMFGEAAFDVVWHGHSLNFVPDARTVFGQVRRVLKKRRPLPPLMLQPILPRHRRGGMERRRLPTQKQVRGGRGHLSDRRRVDIQGGGWLSAAGSGPQGVQAQHGDTPERAYRAWIHAASDERRRPFRPGRRPGAGNVESPAINRAALPGILVALRAADLETIYSVVRPELVEGSLSKGHHERTRFN